MNLSKEEIGYCNLARAFINEAYQATLIKNLIDVSFRQKVINILEVENMLYTKEFEIICGAGLVSKKYVADRLKKNIRSLETLLIFEAREYLYSTLNIFYKKLQKKVVTKKKIKEYLQTEEFKRTCKIAGFKTSDVISMYEERFLI